jgi:cell division septation protein DedD
MDENTKLYVFSKREVALIFLFLLLAALTSFVLGVRVGKSFSYDKSKLSTEDRTRVDLLSGEEEKVNQVVDEVKKEKDTPAIDQDKIKKRLEDLLREETSGETKKVIKPIEEKKEMIELETKAPVVKNEEPESNTTDDTGKNYTGKYTINLASYQSIEDAKNFAEGFKVRGYTAIIVEAELPDRGVWYRVSIGVFDTVTEAKNYVKDEKSLFQGQDYRFRRFD